MNFLWGLGGASGTGTGLASNQLNTAGQNQLDQLQQASGITSLQWGASQSPIEIKNIKLIGNNIEILVNNRIYFVSLDTLKEFEKLLQVSKFNDKLEEELAK